MGKTAKNGFNPRAFLAKVGDGKTMSKYRKDQTIFTQGDIADTIYYIQKGKVKIVVVSDQGKEAVVAILEADQFFGEGCLNGQLRRIATATTIGECTNHLDHENSHDGRPSEVNRSFQKCL